MLGMRALLLMPLLVLLAASLLSASTIHEVFAANAVKVIVKPAKDPITRGSTQTISAKVTASNGKPLANALMTATVTYTTGYIREFHGTTDKNGNWQFSWQIGSNSKPGVFVVEMWAHKGGYGNGYGKATFTVNARR